SGPLEQDTKKQLPVCQSWISVPFNQSRCRHSPITTPDVNKQAVFHTLKHSPPISIIHYNHSWIKMRFLAIGLLAMSLLFCQSVSSFYLKRSDSRSHFSMLSSPSRPEIVPSDSEVPKNHRVAVVPTNGRSRSKRQLVLHGDDPQTAII
ncbi:hypothetical protein TCAL_12034, partial [Tigriopus californicus]